MCPSLSSASASFNSLIASCVRFVLAYTLPSKACTWETYSGFVFRLFFRNGSHACFRALLMEAIDYAVQIAQGLAAAHEPKPEKQPEVDVSEANKDVTLNLVLRIKA